MCLWVRLIVEPPASRIGKAKERIKEKPFQFARSPVSLQGLVGTIWTERPSPAD
jgi:hypothetical protein